jgi:putative drug exporter of the RND superfamily
MAELLYRLGRFSARRAWAVLISWIVVLGLSTTAYFVWSGTLSSQVNIPGTPTQAVADQLRDKFPSASGGSGTVVFKTENGAFTEDQKAAIGTALKNTAKLAGVNATVNPFDTQAQIAERTAQIAAGEQQVTQGRAQLDAGAKQIDSGLKQVDAGLKQPGLPAAQKAALQAQKAELDKQKAGLDQKRAQLEAGAAQAEAGKKLLELSSGIRTVSADNTTAVAQIAFKEAAMDVLPETKTAVIDQITADTPAGVEADFSNEITQTVPQVLGVGEVAGLIIAAIALLVMLGSVIAAALPLVSAIVGVGVGVTVSLAMSGAVDMLSITPVLGVMLGLAVGIDYCLFILNRHRKQLLDGVELHESIGLANGTSGNAVVFAGSTVLVALLALNVTGIGFLGMMGTVGAICVAVAVVVAITFTPALLALLGTRILSKKARAAIGHAAHAKTPSTPMGTGRAVLTVIGGLIVLLAVAIPALSMRLGLPDGSSESKDSTQYQAYKTIEDKFGAGVNGPLLVVAEEPKALTDAEGTAEQLRIGTLLKAVKNVSALAPIGLSSDKTLVAFQVIPAEGPNSESTQQLVRDLRDLSPLEGDVKLGVAGNASGNIDVSQKLADALPLYLGVVLGLSLIILIFVFRSILVPLTATLGFVLSLFATFGGITAIFQWGWLGAAFDIHDPGPILSFLPTILIGIMFGLAMDYQLFLVSGMREAYAHGAPAKLAVRQGLHAGRVVVTAAAIIMIAVFGGFIFSHTTMIRSLGFGLAFGVLVDAFLVRMLLIPAIMHLLGRSAWWIPRWLDRILPNVDVEGTALERTHPLHPAPADASEPEPAAAK